MEERNLIEETVRSLNLQWMKSYTQHDVEFLNTHMADSYVGTYPDGSVHNKQTEIESVKSGKIAILEIQPIEMSVQIYNGNTAVLTGTSNIKANIDGKEISDNFRFTDVWVKTKERWQAVASQVTRIDHS
jgi:ketosteroid isomerase-like protein